ncbi:unnamed protein product [Echinostoma caproni]|uniref:Uncharacterized protein n=1 Tax=Echinostoma caproni TaxID=27848 RepID=A0A183B7S3_9TREM|nr:unnamed protein product [Echinostoma caproni]
MADPRSFYRDISLVTQAKPWITDITSADGSLTDGSTGAANILPEYHSTMFSSEHASRTDGSDHPAKDPMSSRIIEPVSFSPAQVGLKLLSLAAKTSSGLDEILPVILEQYAEQLAPPYADCSTTPREYA